ncbi:MAG TPA: thiamine biosynthesis protein ThiS [Oceanospirillales bacterium]|nr:thiamine biosynthesis protein ThiS [Oleispira sp.]HCM05608.1 thiamine biosynthesis protein ThiS [Oceanospirillales bacterium]|tara:strand:- start:1068 stop:1289 length:222 start_codon:yes stop_codon:yes gene_type:complete
MNIRIYVNNTEFTVPKNCTLSQAINKWLADDTQDNTDNYAIALNQKFISRALYDTTLLNNDDDIELLTPMAGG